MRNWVIVSVGAFGFRSELGRGKLFFKEDAEWIAELCNETARDAGRALRYEAREKEDSRAPRALEGAARG
jgi:hypothetical protein